MVLRLKIIDLTPERLASDNIHVSGICLRITPATAITAPIIIAVQAAVVVPLFQYNPPMITAPDPPAKMAAVMAKNNAIF